MTIDLSTLTIKKAHEGMVSGAFSAVDLAKAYLDEIKKKDHDINAFREVFVDVIEQAEKARTKLDILRTSITAWTPYGPLETLD